MGTFPLEAGATLNLLRAKRCRYCAICALASAKDPYGVTIGAIVGHAFCTSLAVIGGKILALKISQRLVAVVGGMLFIVFAWHALIFGAPGTELSKND